MLPENIEQEGNDVENDLENLNIDRLLAFDVKNETWEAISDFNVYCMADTAKKCLKTNRPKAKPKLFSELLKSQFKEYAGDILDILKELSPSVVDDNNNSLLKSPYILKVFYQSLLNKGIAAHKIWLDIADVFADRYPGINKHTILSNQPKNKANDYATDIEERLDLFLKQAFIR